MGQRALENSLVGEGVADPRFEFVACLRLAAHRTIVNSLDQRTVHGQRHTFQAASPVDREEDDLGAADEVVERHIADLAQHAAVGRVVAVVAHHEVVAGRHRVDLRVVVEGVIDEIERVVAHAVRQRLLPALDALDARPVLGADKVLGLLALDRHAVDVEQALDHLDLVARQPDHALDVVGGVLARQAEHHDVAAASAASRRCAR